MLKNYRCVITLAYPQQKSALSFIYVRIASSQGKVHTAVVDKFTGLLIWFTQVLRMC